MKQFIKQNIFIVLIGIFSLMSTAFLVGDYSLSNNQKAITNVSSKSIEVKYEKEEFESSDFNMFKNISEAIDELFSLGF